MRSTPGLRLLKREVIEVNVRKLLIVLVGLTLTAHAQAQRNGGMDDDDVLRLLDFDGDNTVSFDEIDQAVQRLRRMDKNGDKRLSESELSVYRGTPRRTERSAEMARSESEPTVDAQEGNYYVNQSEDDAEERINHDVNVTSDDLDFGQSSVGGFETAIAIGVRFDGIKVAQGSKIKRAFLQFTKDVSPTESEPTELQIRAELAADAPSFAEKPRNITSRTMTKSVVNWVPEPWNPEQRRGESSRTPDLSPLIQEVVGHDGWKEGSAVVLVITGDGERDAISFDSGDKRYVPMLHVSTQ